MRWALALTALLASSFPTTSSRASAAEVLPGLTYLSVVSEPGDWVGQGQTRTWLAVEAPFSVRREGGWVRVESALSLAFAAPDGVDLVPGTR